MIMLLENDLLYGLLKRIAALRKAPITSRASFPARESPYKPVLLLSVIKRIQQGKTSYIQNEILFKQCVEDFSTLYTALFGNNYQLETKVTQAFWYWGAGTPRIWQLIPRTGTEEALNDAILSKVQIKTPRKLQSLVLRAEFRDSDWKLLVDPDVQKALISFIMNEHFADIGRALARL